MLNRLFFSPANIIRTTRPAPLRLIAIILIVLLTGCQMHPHFHRHKAGNQAAAFRTHWDLSGKISIHSDRQNITATMDWSQRGKSYQIDLVGPMGQGRAIIDGRPQQVTMTLPDGSQTQSTTADLLLEKLTGVKVPVQAMLWWIQGLPVTGVPISEAQQLSPKKHSLAPHTHTHPHTPGEQASAKQRYQSFIQLGWKIQYSQFHSSGAQLPKTLTLTSRNHRVKILIKQWQLQQP